MSETLAAVVAAAATLIGEVPAAADEAPDAGDYRESRRQFEIAYLTRKLREHGGNVTRTAAAIGLSALLLHSEAAFTMVKIGGAAYLVWLAFKAFRDGGGTASLTGQAPTSLGRIFLEAVMTNVLNPKVAVFYLTFLPQFIDPRGNVLAQSLLLATLHAVMGVVWLTAYAYVLGRLARGLAGGALRRVLERVTGIVLVGLGVRLAFERR